MLVADIEFLDLFFLLFIWIPVAIAWATAVIDIVARRHDKSWPVRALMLFFVLVLPLLGTLVYFLTRPVLPEEKAARDSAVANIEAAKASSFAQALDSLVRLRDAGELTEAEYEEKKTKIKAAQ